MKKWIDKHNREIFRKQVRLAVAEKLLNHNREYECFVEEIKDNFGYIVGLKINFRFKGVVELAINTKFTKPYFDYENETVDSASNKIIEDIKYFCHDFRPDMDARRLMNTEAFSVYLISRHILDELGDEE